MTAPSRVASLTRLSQADAEGVEALIERVATADGVAPMSEQHLLRLRSDNPEQRWRHIVASGEDGVVGYAIVETDPGDAEGELVVDPRHRRRGIGSTLLEAADEFSAGRPLRLWAHGHVPAAREFARTHRMQAIRTLWQLRRDLAAPLPPVEVPDTITLRPFDPPRDAQSWVELNAAAFAEHPEQGKWTIEDLRAREREGWFDPTGFLIAEVRRPLGELRPGELAGFHWTKIHGPSTTQLAAAPTLAAEALGEVYVVGVSPKAQGAGLGRVLTIAGLQHLRDRGLPTVLLYVDDDNEPAMRLYRALGFTEYAVDVQYLR